MTVSYAMQEPQEEESQAIQTLLATLFGERARALARATGFVQRHSPIDGAVFARTLVFGFEANAQATYTDLQQVMAAQEVVVSPQAIEKRMTHPASQFLLSLLEEALTMAVVGPACALGHLSGFESIILQDGTRITLPDDLREVWRGTGGRTGSGAEAGLRVQVRLNLCDGQLQGPWMQHGCDLERGGASSFEATPLPIGSLVITDTAYQTLERMRAENASERWYLAPASMTPKVITADGITWDLPTLITTRAAQGHAQIDEPILVGKGQRVPCRLIAVPNPKPPTPKRREQPARRKGSRHDVQIGRKKAPKGKRGRKKHEMGQQRQRLRGWIVMVTNVPSQRLSPQQARELLRARWQIELLWKLWKQEGQVDTWRSEKAMRILCELYAKLLALTLQHWLSIMGCWQDPHRSLVKASFAVQKLSLSLLLTLDGPIDGREVLRRSRCMMQRCRLNPRRTHPNTSQRLAQQFLS